MMVVLFKLDCGSAGSRRRLRLQFPLAAGRKVALLCRNPTSKFNIMAHDPVTHHFFKGFIRLHILYHAAKEPIYGAEITDELVRHGYRLSQGTLYPTLHMLEQLGYLKSRTEVVAGKQRKYYQATDAGRKVVAEARPRLLELVSEVVQDQHAPFRQLRRNRNSHRSRNRRKSRAKK